MNTEKKTMRDVFIEQIYDRMSVDSSIFFVTGDFGAPKLDNLRRDFKDRFLNVGIAEQNLINVSAGLALEGFTPLWEIWLKQRIVERLSVSRRKAAVLISCSLNLRIQVFFV